MNKKGFLLAEETLKIIIALISLGFLVYFLGALYFANQDSKELEQAKASLEFLVKEINDGRKEVTIFNPEAGGNTLWQVVFFDASKRNFLPNSCTNLKADSCACICGPKVTDFAFSEEALVGICDSYGACGKLNEIYTTEGLGWIEKNVDGYEYAFPLEDLPLTLKIKEKTISR